MDEFKYLKTENSETSYLKLSRKRKETCKVVQKIDLSQGQPTSKS